MDAEFTQANLRIFLKAVACCSKIGVELFLEGGNDGLVLSTVNSTKSVFTSFTFNALFFNQYRVHDETICHCKLSMKAFSNALKVFQSASFSSDSKYSFSISNDPPRIIIGYTSHVGITRRKFLTFETSRPMRAIFTKDTPSYVKCNPNIFEHPAFTSSIDIELQFRQNDIRMMNWFDSKNAPDKKMKTAITLRVARPHFDKYQINTATQTPHEPESDAQSNSFRQDQLPSSSDTQPTQQGSLLAPKSTDFKPVSLVFVIKEFKSILQFSSSIGAPLNLYFSEPGKPLIVSIRIPNYIDVDFVLATLIVRPDQVEPP